MEWLEHKYALILLAIMVWAGHQLFQYVDVVIDEEQGIVGGMVFSTKPTGGEIVEDTSVASGDGAEG